jgi:hypothetical protein
MESPKGANVEVKPGDSAVESATTTSVQPRRRLIQRPRGWRLSILTGTGLALITLIINATVSGVAASKEDIIQLGGSDKALHEGDCDNIRNLNIGIHFIINLLSTFLLGASNYAMQCLSAPTREEVDQAHSKRIWLDIGVSSIRNLRRISSRRAFLWIILAVSSLPLHLL